ncbi:MAG: FapA family protein, partial [bacterium]|nr:FapA family protein [bacterium]
QSPSPPFTIKEDGSVDFHNLKKIISVKKDDLIVTVTPATPGLPGFTVTGQSLPGIQGKKTGIVAGEHIDKQAKQHDWLAAVDGYLFFIDQVVSVHSILTIAGDVDFSTGNIDFLGDVYIVGNVLDEFTVKASGSIFIGGSVEAAQLEACQTICVQQGVFGKEKGRVHAQQDIIATFYQNARVEAGRDVIAGNQILNSRIKARRHIIAKTGQGRIIGGELLAGHTLTAKQIGSDLGTRTTIETGLDYHILDQMTRLGKKRDTLTRQAAQLADWIKKNKGLPTEPINPNFLLAQRKQVEIQLILDQIQSEYQELSQSLYPPTEAQITALGILMPDVYIKIRDARTKVISPHTHCTVKYNPESERIELRKFKIG